MSLTRYLPLRYNHTQSTAASVWTIVHNLNRHPVVDAYTEENGDLLKVIPASVTYVNSNTVELSFSTARTGFASVI